MFTFAFKEWIQLPLSLIGTQLEAIFNALGDHWIKGPSSESTESHESPKEDVLVRHDVELERWTEPPDTDWLFKLAKDNRSVFSVHDLSETTETLKCAASNHPPIEDAYCSDETTTDKRNVKKMDI